MAPGNLKATKVENHQTTELEDHSFELIDGTILTIDEVKKKLADRTPVLLIPAGEKIHPFFQAILKPDTVVVVTRKEPNQ